MYSYCALFIATTVVGRLNVYCKYSSNVFTSKLDFTTAASPDWHGLWYTHGQLQ